MIFVFEIIGGFVRYLSVNAYYKIVGRSKTKTLDHFMNDENGKMFTNLNKDYSNGIVGFVSFGLLLYFGYLLLN